MKRTILIITGVIILSNLSFFKFYLQENFQYENADGSFYYSEESGKGKTFIGCVRTYGHFLCEHPDKDQWDNRLYRTFTIKPWRFWEWSDMLFSERFRLPYKEAHSR
jgi:hypothetical protein